MDCVNNRGGNVDGTDDEGIRKDFRSKAKRHCFHQNMQMGFMPGQGTTDAIFMVKQLLGKIYFSVCKTRQGLWGFYLETINNDIQLVLENWCFPERLGNSDCHYHL